MFACDYRDSNGLRQLKDSNRLRAYVPELSHCLVTNLADAQQLQLQLDSTAQPDSTEQTKPTALTPQHTEQRHLYEPLMSASREWQVVAGATPTAPLVGTTKVSAHPAHTPRARLNARDREPVSNTPNPFSRVNSLPRLRDSTGKPSKSRDGSAAVESESLTHPVNRNAALTDDGDRGLPHPASAVNAVMSAVHSCRFTTFYPGVKGNYPGF